MTQAEQTTESLPAHTQQPAKRRKVGTDPDQSIPEHYANNQLSPQHKSNNNIPRPPYTPSPQSHLEHSPNKDGNRRNSGTNGISPHHSPVKSSDDPSSINGSTIPRPPTYRDHPSSPTSRIPRAPSRDDDLRPPRRPSQSTEPINNRSSSYQPTGLAPDVDAELHKIFASGLFERKDIDGRALDFLAGVPPSLAMAALEDIQRRDFSTVRSKPAFIMSIFKRVVQSGGSAPPPPGPPPGGYTPTSVPASALAHLPPAVSDALQRVFASGVCHPSQFDDRAMDILVDLQEPDAVRALSEFAAMEPGRVRNPSAFWMGLARKFKGHASRSSRMGPPPGDGGSSYGSYDGSMGYSSRRINDSGMYSTLDQRLDELSASGQLPRSVLDDRALDALRRLPEQDAIAVLAELPEPARVRNMSAYVMGLCKKFATGEARSLSGRSSSYGPPYGGGYNSGYSSGPPYGSGSASYGSGGGYGPSGGGPPPYSSSYGGYSSSYNVGSSNSDPPYGPPMSQHNASSRAREVREALDAMDPAVSNRFYAMTDRGIITETSFDGRAISALQNMQREEACAALDELAASEPGRIHNISAYFMGLAKKFSRPPM